MSELIVAKRICVGVMARLGYSHLDCGPIPVGMTLIEDIYSVAVDYSFIHISLMKRSNSLLVSLLWLRFTEIYIGQVSISKLLISLVTLDVFINSYSVTLETLLRFLIL